MMRVLLDECLPRPLTRDLVGHDIWTVAEMGWSGQPDGALLGLMAANGFEVLVTVDRNFRYQQQVTTIAVIVLIAVSNRYAALRPLVASTLAILPTLTAGQIVEVRT